MRLLLLRRPRTGRRSVPGQARLRAHRTGQGRVRNAAATGATQVVDDVHAFPGHIACDADSRSEIVVPLIRDGRLIGVWDVDSPEPSRFDATDRAGMERLCDLFIASLGD
ncbi:MAG: GAF domain-containing protein [Dokdonella sp.]|nr:GAF domain-containing protein [Dokdonella sp.]